MAPKNENTNTEVQQTLPDFFEQFNKELSINYPTEDKYEEGGDQVLISLKLGDFKPEDIKVTLDPEYLLCIEGKMSGADEDREHTFYRTCALPYPCQVENISTEALEDNTFVIKVLKDEEKTALMLKQRQEEEEKTKEALEKFNSMAEMKPITLEEYTEDEESYKVKVNLGNYKEDEVNTYFNGPHYLIIEGIKEQGEVKRRYFRHLYFDAPCNTEGQVEVQRNEDGLLFITVPKDTEAIKAIEQFNQQMKPIQELFSDPEVSKDNGFNMTLNISSFGPDEVKVSFEDDMMVVEANHEAEEGQPSFSLYRKFSLPEGVTREQIQHRIDNGQLKISAQKPNTLRQG